MKNKVINAAVCDARGATEESFAGFENITINAAVLITGERSKELMNRYHVTLHVANVIEIPDGENVILKSVNGKCELGPDSDGEGVFLMVNGKLIVGSGSVEAVKKYYRIMVNGKAMLPESCRGKLRNITVNGSEEYYPDGAFIMDANTEIDDLFVSRAGHTLYYCPGSLFFLDASISTERIAEKGIRFAAQKIVIAESLLAKLLPAFDEEAEIVLVPDGARLIGGDLELKVKTIWKYGTKLCVSGDVSILDADALTELEYLYAGGTVGVDKTLEEAFDEKESVYKALRIVDSKVGLLSDRAAVKIGAATLKKYPNGVRIEDCAKVVISGDLSAEDIMDKLHISDCALVVCTEEQEEAVNMICEDVARVSIAGRDDRDEGGILGGILGGIFGGASDTQMINAAEFKM